MNAPLTGIIIFISRIKKPAVMKQFCFPIRLSTIIFLVAGFTVLSGQSQTGNDYKPRSGQDGKDVIWVPTPQVNVIKMLDIAGVTPEDFVIDLGSGDGRLVIEAARRGARARGIEYNTEMVELSRRRAVQSRVSDRVEFIEGDLFEADLSKASVITMFLLNTINLKLRPSLLDLKPGTRIASNTFHMGDWVADSTARGDENCDHYCTALLWIVPAKIAGTWVMNEGVMNLDQKYQMVTGSLRTPSETIRITDCRLRGDVLTFTHKFQRYAGRVKGGVIEGFVTSGNKCREWRAERLQEISGYTVSQ